MKKNRVLSAVLCALLLTGCTVSAPGRTNQETQDKTISKISAEDFTSFGGCAALRHAGQLTAAAATGSKVEKAANRISFYGSSDEAWQRLMRGELDVVLAYAPDASTAQALEKQGISPKVAGTDALVFLAGGTVQPQSLTRAQISAAYRNGGTEQWKGYAAAPGSSARQLFADQFGGDDMGVTVTEGETVLTAACPHTAGSLCCTTYLALRERSQPQGTALVAVDGTLPEETTLPEPGTSEESAYPLQTNYYIACRSGLDKDNPAMLFYNWLTSESGRHWLYQATIGTEAAAAGEAAAS